tara:strand:- start:19285 stop:19665 length:381 start_codon:yes stop_codon:yes gene_type:complete
LIEVQLTQSLPIIGTLFDGKTDRFLRARVYDAAFNEVAGSPFSMPHLSNGTYINQSFIPSVIGNFTAIVEVYTDAAFTLLDEDYQKGKEIFLVSERVAKQNEILTDIETAQNTINENIDTGESQAI